MHSLSLKFRITILALLVAVVPLAMFQVISVKRSSEILLDFLGNDLEGQSFIMARELNRFLDQRVADARLISQANVFKQNDIDLIRAYLKAVTSGSAYINDINVLDRKGTILISSSNASSPSPIHIISAYLRHSFGLMLGCSPPQITSIDMLFFTASVSLTALE